MPIGATNTDTGLANNADGNPFFDVTIDAVAKGWPEDSHGAAFYYGDEPTGLFQSPYDTSMPVMWEWYTDVFKEKQGIKIGNA